jgi:hypothetical protein
MSRDVLEGVVKGIKRLIREENRHSDPPSAHYIRHDQAWSFLEGVQSFLKGDVDSLDRAFGVRPSPGRPVDPNTSKKNFKHAERAWTLKMQGKTWAEVNNAVFADRAEPPDERHIRRLITRYELLLMRRWLRRRWRAGSEERKQRAILKNSKRGKPDSN